MKKKSVAPDAASEMSKNNEPERSDKDDLGVFQESLKRGGYSGKQVLSFQKTGLVCKRMSLLSNMVGLQADRVTLVIGGNAEGDWKLKPLLVYHTENPRALKGYIKEHFPVIWKAHPQVLVTDDFLQSYVVAYLSPACTEYAAANNLSNKFLLILNHDYADKRSMCQWTENIEVLFLPPHVQPMDQGVTDILKLYYHRRVMQQLVKEINNDKTTPEDFLTKYNIKKAINNISHSWDQVEQSIMNAAWSTVWPEAVRVTSNFQGVTSHHQQLVNDIVRFSQQAGMLQVNDEGVEKLLKSHAEVPSEEEHVQLEPEGSDDPDQQLQPQGLEKEQLKELLDAINKANVIAESHDFNMSRSSKFSQTLESAAVPYQKMYEKQFFSQ